MLYSTVSSHILKSIAEVEGFNTIDTLTGFKWLGNKSDELIKNNKHVLFAFEEAMYDLYLYFFLNLISKNKLRLLCCFS